MPTVRFAPGTGRPTFSEGAEYFHLVLTLSEASSETVTATVAVGAYPSEADGADVDTGHHVVTFAPGQTSANLWVRIWGDSEDERDEDLLFHIIETTNASRDLSDPSAFKVIGELVDDDLPAGPTVRFAPGTGSAGFAEGSGHVELVLELSEASSETVTANVSIFGSEAWGSDIDQAAKTVTFAPGETSAILRVPVYEDLTDEPDESVTFRIGEVTGAYRDLSSDSAYQVTTRILDNDAAPSRTVRFAPGTPVPVVTEDGGYFEFTLLMSQAHVLTVYADIDLGGDWDHADLDAMDTRAVFAPGQTVATLRLPIRDDGLDEIDEQISFEIRDVFNAAVDYSSPEAYRLEGRIIDNDGPPAQLVGTAGADVLIGTAGSDLIRGLDGDDVINPGIGDDEVAGGEGNDFLILDWSDSTAGQGMSWLQYGSTVSGKYWSADGHSVSFSYIEGFRIIAGSGDDGILVAGYGTVDAGPGNDSISVVSREFSADGGSGELDGLAVDLSWVTTPMDWSVPDNRFSGHGPQTFTNFEYLFDLDTGSAADRIETGHAAVSDNISSGAGDDRIIFYNGWDTAHGGEGEDELIVDWREHGASIVRFTDFATPGAVGAIKVNFSRTVDFDGIERLSLLTGAEADRITGSAGAETVDGGGGGDTISGRDGNDRLIGGTGMDLLEGEGGDDWLQGGADADQLAGGAGKDRLEGGAGVDTLRGGADDDSYYVEDSGDIIEELAGEGTDEVLTALAAYSLPATEVEKLTALTDSNHDFRGNAGDNIVTGAGGNDFLRLYDGGKDSAFGGAGNDVILLGASMSWNDFVDGGAGADQLVLQGHYVGGSALIFGGGVVSIENIAILPGDDTRFGDAGTSFYDYKLTLQNATVAAGVQMIVDANRLRSGEDLTFNGSAETDGSFFIYGGGGADHLTGGSGNDVFLFGAWGQWNSGDVVVGGAGLDQLALRGNYSLTFGAGQLVGIENIGLLSAHDTRFGALGSSYSYDLTMVDGNVAAGVQMIVDGAKLRVAEFFRFDGSQELDGSFRVFGGLVDDTIVASRNNDFLQGNGGLDTLTGGLGADTFRYLSTSDSTTGSADRILDFTPGTDVIDLSRIDANSQAAGNQAFSWIGSNAFTGSGAASAGELRAYQSGQSWFVEGDTDGNGVADLVIDLTLVVQTPLGPGDFVL